MVSLELPNEQIVENERFFTVPTTLMTLPRLAASAIIPYLALKGEKTTALTSLAAASDAEGFVGRAIDQHWPGSGLGCSKPGEEWDYGSDAALILGTSIADIIGQNSHPFTRLAGAITGARVLEQASWAAPAMGEYKKLTGEKLRIKVGLVGKCATAATLLSAGLSAISRDVEPTTHERRTARRILACASLVSAAAGYGFGQAAIKENHAQFREKIIAYKRKQLLASQA